MTLFSERVLQPILYGEYYAQSHTCGRCMWVSMKEAMQNKNVFLFAQ